MNDRLDILDNPNETFENDFCIINLKTEEITWKPGKFRPKLKRNILYWFSVRRERNSKLESK